MQRTGRIHVYYGDGKGKTSAAFGMAARMAGHGKRVLILQFFKERGSGEAEFFSGNELITVLRGTGSDKFVFEMTETEKRNMIFMHNENMKKAIELSGEADMLVLDEALDSAGYCDEELLIRLITGRPERLEVVITGHNKVDWVFRAADYITELKKVRHPFDSGLSARLGIEF